MPTYNNRVNEEAIVYSVTFDETTVSLETSLGSFTVPSNVLTRKIYESPDYPYNLEFDVRSRVLSGIRSPEDTTLYRIDDSAVRKIANSAEYLARLIKDHKTVSVATALPLMMEAVAPHFKDRLQKLPTPYLNEYFVYEVKISYLASNPGEPLIFDPTPSEKAHALALSMVDSGDFPPLIQKTY